MNRSLILEDRLHGKEVAACALRLEGTDAFWSDVLRPTVISVLSARLRRDTFNSIGVAVPYLNGLTSSDLFIAFCSGTG